MSTTNQATIHNVSAPDLGRLKEIKEKIIHCQTSCDQSYLKMGRLLLDAKQQFGSHGEWLIWVRDNVDLSICKVQRLMKVAAWMDQNEAPVPHLDFSKAYILSRLPPPDLEKFLDLFHLVPGKQPKIPIKILLENKELTKRELEEAVRDFLKSKDHKPATIQAQQKLVVPVAPSNTIAAHVDKVKIILNELVDLIEKQGKNSDSHEPLIEDLQELRNYIIEHFPGETLECL